MIFPLIGWIVCCAIGVLIFIYLAVRIGIRFHVSKMQIWVCPDCGIKNLGDDQKCIDCDSPDGGIRAKRIRERLSKKTTKKV